MGFLWELADLLLLASRLSSSTGRGTDLEVDVVVELIGGLGFNFCCLGRKELVKDDRSRVK